MTDKTLREVIARTWYADFYDAELSKASEFRTKVAYEITDAILAIPELQEALRDAERYRWLKHHIDGMPPWAETDSAWETAETLDAAIDARKEEG